MIYRAGDQLLDFRKPLVMGVINITPDSFYAQSRMQSLDDTLMKIEKMKEDGAKIVDIGGMSSRPGAATISADEEWERIGPVIKEVVASLQDVIFSVDTIHSKVADKSLNAGVHMINDISAGSFDPQMIPTVKDYQATYIAMHMQGQPSTMQNRPQYDDVVYHILQFFVNKLRWFEKNGVYDVVIDPGFGFGKTLEHNYDLLRQLHVFKMLERPLMVGISRKSMIYKVLKTDAENALNGTTACHMVALQQGARILRVHDVKEAVETIRLFEELYSKNGDVQI